MLLLFKVWGFCLQVLHVHLTDPIQRELPVHCIGDTLALSVPGQVSMGIQEVQFCIDKFVAPAATKTPSALDHNTDA